MGNFYDFEALNIKGGLVKMNEYQGKMILVVNTASHCGFTPQFEGLERLYEEYKDKGLVILGFPCNQFAGQEPGDAEEILSFCQLNYKVSFPMFDKIKVNGKEAHPIFAYLKSELGDILGPRIKWNFTKFLINRSGQPIKRFSPKDTPEMIKKYLTEII